MANMPSYNERGWALIAACVLFSLLVLVVVALRMLRNIRFRKFGFDDGLILIATLLNFTTNSILIAAAVFGDGHHLQDIHNPKNLVRALTLPWITQPVSAFTLLFAKTSVGASLLRLGLGHHFSIIVIITLVIVSFGNAWAGISVVTGCNPTTQHGGGAPCRTAAAADVASYFQSVANIVCDLVFFLAPEFFLRGIRLSARDRMAIRFLLSFMLLATIMSVCKLAMLPILLSSQDITWTSAPVSSFSVAEVGLSIVAACLPALRQLFGNYFPQNWLFRSKTMSSEDGGEESMEQPLTDIRKESSRMTTYSVHEQSEQLEQSRGTSEASNTVPTLPTLRLSNLSNFSSMLVEERRLSRTPNFSRSLAQQHDSLEDPESIRRTKSVSFSGMSDCAITPDEEHTDYR